VKPFGGQGAKAGSTQRKRGGQPGHSRHERPKSTPDEINRMIEYRPDTCPCCGEPLIDRGASPNVESFHQIEVPLKRLCVTQHCRHTRWLFATIHRRENAQPRPVSATR
jgi:transposase